ncbi:unnamed protein product [Jaminaea pallidilutea]
MRDVVQADNEAGRRHFGSADPYSAAGSMSDPHTHASNKWSVDDGLDLGESSSSPSATSSDTEITAPEAGPSHSSKWTTRGLEEQVPDDYAFPPEPSIDDLWHVHLDPMDPNGPHHARTTSERNGWRTFDYLSQALEMSCRIPAHQMASSEQAQRPRPRPVPWYDPRTPPSPAALYSWRMENARRFNLELASPAEVLFWKYFVRLNYEQKHHQRIILDQHIFEDRALRQRSPLVQARNGNGESGRPAMMCIFSGIAEAEAEQPTQQEAAQQAQQAQQVQNEAATDGTQPTDSGDAKSANKNRKAFPLNFYLDRSRFQQEWTDWCRQYGSNAQNVLFDYASFASHNPHSIYHKVKYGDWGSPHPYVPFGITNPEEFEKSRQDQIRQEHEAVEWVRGRRSLAATQHDLHVRAQRLIAERDQSRTLAAATDPSGKPAASASPKYVPVALPDDVVVDQELEQPQAMGKAALTEATSASGVVRPDDVTPGAQTPSQAGTGDAEQLQASTDEGVPKCEPLPEVQKAQVAAATSHTNPITVSVIIPDNLMPWIRGRVFQQLKRDYPDRLSYYCDDTTRKLPLPLAAESVKEPFVRLKPVINVAAVVTDDELPWRSRYDQPVLRFQGDEEYAASSGLTGPTHGPRWSSQPTPEEPPSTFRLGNMFLSSCPGKKVRLGGAVRGRGAVCRDLGIDLKRFQALGVGTLVCCLSDAELGVIGVQWEEYVQEADRLAIDIVRLPMVEGNCPTSPEALDGWLNEIIENCTLKGINVLVHCRGGVGRAGTVAACWLIKMGFVDECRSAEEQKIRGQIWPSQEILWQCLQVVRLRRSSKAIETAEQAAYIARFAQYTLDAWKQKRPNSPALEKGYCKMVADYWKRIRMETAYYLEQLQRDGANSLDQTSASNGNGTSEGSSTEINGHQSNINARHAAQMPEANAHAEVGQNGSQSNAEAATEGAGVSMPRNTDGEPTPKRRNTLTTNNGGSSSSSTPLMTAADAAETAAFKAASEERQSTTERALAADGSRLGVDEMELDAFPVDGRRVE